MAATVDHAPVRVSGDLIRMQRARVIWAAGRLYVTGGGPAVHSWDVADKPRGRGGVYTATTADGQTVTWRKAGCRCSCGTLCSTPRADIVDAAAAPA